jgi:hypothetical protein
MLLPDLEAKRLTVSDNRGIPKTAVMTKKASMSAYSTVVTPALPLRHSGLDLCMESAPWVRHRQLRTTAIDERDVKCIR